jgi:hypothetical protein
MMDVSLQSKPDGISIPLFQEYETITGFTTLEDHEMPFNPKRHHILRTLRRNNGLGEAASGAQHTPSIDKA